MFPQVIHINFGVTLDQNPDLGQNIHMVNPQNRQTLPAGKSAASPGASALHEKLYSVALERVRQRGFEAVTVSEVTREANVAKGTFFNYFRSKDHILSEYLKRTLSEILKDLADRGQSGTEAILSLSDLVVSRLMADPKVAAALIPRLGSLPPSTDGAPSEIESLQEWIQSRLAETLPVRVPLVDPPHRTSLPSHLTWALRGKLEEWARGGMQGGKNLGKSVRKEVGFLLASAGLPGE